MMSAVARVLVLLCTFWLSVWAVLGHSCCATPLPPPPQHLLAMPGVLPPPTASSHARTTPKAVRDLVKVLKVQEDCISSSPSLQLCTGLKAKLRGLLAHESLKLEPLQATMVG